METCKCGQAAGQPAGAGPAGTVLMPLHLAIATIPLQPWETLYPPQRALCRGTAFPSLDLPFYAGGDLHV